jgi:hypothetical protein
MRSLSGRPNPLQVARICRVAENAYVGVESGIMDQLASAAAVAGHALCIDCRDETVSPVGIPPGLAVLVVHSGVQRALRHSSFNQRREECRRAAAALGVGSLRDASLDDLAAADRMGNVPYRRARHVVTENRRVGEAARALAGGDTERLRELFAASHESLARDYEVSTPSSIPSWTWRCGRRGLWPPGSQAPASAAAPSTSSRGAWRRTAQPRSSGATRRGPGDVDGTGSRARRRGRATCAGQGTEPESTDALA